MSRGQASRIDDKAVADNSILPRPVVKWAGGKRALLAEITRRFPADFGTYFEPFLGGGAVYFSLPDSQPKIGNDANSELIDTYLAIRDDVDAVLLELRKFRNTKADYLAIRAWDRSPQFKRRNRFTRAARFIFLNKCGFNGLHRVNSDGQHNVPYGYSPKADFVQEANLRRVADFLKAKTVKRNNAARLTSGDYQQCVKSAKSGDFVYLDPPYQPISKTSAFVSYLEGGFSLDDQRELRDVIVDLTSRGVKVLLSNSDAKEIHALYSDKSMFTIDLVVVRRVIAADSRKRKQIHEVIVSNFAGATNG